MLCKGNPGTVLRWDEGNCLPPNLSLAPNIWLQQQYTVVKRVRGRF